LLRWRNVLLLRKGRVEFTVKQRCDSVPLRNGSAVRLGLALNIGQIYPVEHFEPSQTAVGPRRVGNHDVRNCVKRECVDAHAAIFGLGECPQKLDDVPLAVIVEYVL